MIESSGLILSPNVVGGRLKNFTNNCGFKLIKIWYDQYGDIIIIFVKYEIDKETKNSIAM